MAVDNMLTGLMALVDGADSAPSEESFTVMKRLCEGSNKTLQAWKELKGKELADFNKFLVANKLNSLPDYPEVPQESSCGN